MVYARVRRGHQRPETIAIMKTPMWHPLLKLAIIGNLVLHGEAYASYLVNGFCTRSLTPGTIIMGNPIAESTARSLTVSRNGVALTSGDTYVYGETLTVDLTSTNGEYLLQALGGATFTGTSTSPCRTSYICPRD